MTSLATTIQSNISTQLKGSNMKMTEKKYRRHRGAYDGYCIKCDDITREGRTEPDAEEYHCPECDGNTVLGMDYALMGEYFVFPDEV
jgi:hypothetical protein